MDETSRSNTESLIDDDPRTMASHIERQPYQSLLMPTLLSAMTWSLTDSLMSPVPSIRQFIHSPHLREVIANSNGITDVVCQLFGMPESARHNMVRHLSRLLSNQIARFSLWQDIRVCQPQGRGRIFDIPLPDLIHRLSEFLKICSVADLADVTSLHSLYPDDNFIKLELQGFALIRQQIDTHLAILRKYINGEILLSQELNQVKEDLAINKVPGCWLEKTFPTVSNLTDWIQSFQINSNAMLSFSQNYTIFQMHDIDIFLRPDRLIYTFLQTYTRKTFRDVCNIELSATLQTEYSHKDPNTALVREMVLCEAKWCIDRLDFIKEDFENKSVDSDILPQHYTLVLQFRDSNETESKNIYHCPVILTSEFPSLLSTNVIAEIPIAVSKDPLMFFGKGVYIKPISYS